MTELADGLIARLEEQFEGARDPARAIGMAAYMRDQFPYVGLPAPVLRKLCKTAWAGLPAPTADDLRAVATACWERPEREYQYVACDYLRAHVRAAGADFLPVARDLLTTKSWWDTVDPLATRFVGDLVRLHPALTPVMDEWAADENLWLVRTAILHQLHYGTATDTARLFAYCTAQSQHRDFFVRKGIGWALRHYARTDPDAIRAYLTGDGANLSPLSRREAGKWLTA